MTFDFDILNLWRGIIMNYFFGFDTKLNGKIDWFFNFNHLFLITFVVGFIVACLFLFHAKSEKGKKVTKISLACILAVLEIGRTVYKLAEHLASNGTMANFNWWWNISFQMCAIMCWTTVITLVLSAVLKKDNKILGYLYNILFGCAMLGGALTFCYPDCMSADRAFLHFVNIQTVVVHSLLIFVPIYLIKIGEFKVEFKNIWKVFVGFILVGSLAMTASLISGQNFAYSLKFNLINLGIAFPWHLPVVMMLLFAMDLLLYGSFELVRLIGRKLKKQEKIIIEKNNISKLNKAIYTVWNVCSIVFGVLLILGIAALIKQPKTIYGIFCLLGIVYTAINLVFAERFKDSIINDSKQSKKATILQIVLTFIFVLPVGITLLVKELRVRNELSRLANRR